MTTLVTQKVCTETREDGSLLIESARGLGQLASSTGQWLNRWADEAPNRVFLAERNGSAWREESYLSTRERVLAIAQSLLARGMNANTPILIISGNSVDHGLLALAAQYVGIPMIPTAEQYALIPEAHERLVHVVGLTNPSLVYASDEHRFASALALDCFDGVEVVCSVTSSAASTSFASLERGVANVDVTAAHAEVKGDVVAKILMTSGSTSLPKGVITTHQMMCANQAQLVDVLPFLSEKPPVILDWLPWNHVFGGSHNFNMMLANGGSLYIDEGKPTPGLFQTTLDNLDFVCGNLVFNVPAGFALLLKALENNKPLRKRFFNDLDLLFYSGASLPESIWDGFEKMALEEQGRLPLLTSSWGLTETAPACLLQYESSARAGTVGVPLPGLQAKLLPVSEGRFEIRVRGPNVTPGYFKDAKKTAASFDEEGYYLTGDAMTFVDINQPQRGLRFDGRLGEDFKLMTGTWVQSANLRLALLPHLAPTAMDIIITGADRADVGVLVFISKNVLDDNYTGYENNAGAIVEKKLHDNLKQNIANFAQVQSGSARTVSRALVMALPPSIAAGEVTPKGNINAFQVLKNRADLLERLYDDSDVATVLLRHSEKTCS